jgi:hypothetical protein
LSGPAARENASTSSGPTVCSLPRSRACVTASACQEIVH